jgi:membrane dipeptidase
MTKGSSSLSGLDTGAPLADDTAIVSEYGRQVDRGNERLRGLLDAEPAVSLHDHPFRYPALLNTESWGQARLQKRLVFAYNGMAGAGMGATVACTNSWQSRDETLLVLSRLRTDLNHHDGVYVAESVAEIRRRFAAGRPEERPLGVILGLESLTAFADDLDAVELLYGLGVRVAGLIYSEGNILGCGLAQTTDTGLTTQGRAYVRRMNEVGMTIDLAHVGDQTTRDVIALSDRPVLISHAGARGLWPTSRMKSDEVVRALVDRGGVIGVEAAPNTTCSPKRATHNIDAVMDHVEYLIDLVGIDNVALGPDVIFGPHIEMHAFRATGLKSTTGLAAGATATIVDGIENPNEAYWNIAAWLVAHGYADEDILKLTSRNGLQVLSEVIG